MLNNQQIKRRNMIKIDNYRYNAESGNFIIRKNDGFIMGESICLGQLPTAFRRG